jgi:hypothetical protein
MPAASAAPEGVIEKIGAPTHQDAIKYILHTGIGGSPRVLNEEVRVISGHGASFKKLGRTCATADGMLTHSTLLPHLLTHQADHLIDTEGNAKASN